MKSKVIGTIAAIVFLGTTSFSQQEKKGFGLELNTGASIVTNKPGNIGLKPGPAVDFNLSYRFMPHFCLFAGWGWSHFDAKNTIGGKNADFEETGYTFGIEFNHPMGQSAMSYFLRGVGTYKHIEIEDSEGKPVANSGHGFGWQIAGGIDLALNHGLSLSPGVHFNSLSRKTEIEGGSKTLELNTVSLRVGIRKQF